jgi:hypothetical protein
VSPAGLTTWDECAGELAALYRRTCGVPDRAGVRTG